MCTINLTVILWGVHPTNVIIATSAQMSPKIFNIKFQTVKFFERFLDSFSREGGLIQSMSDKVAHRI